ncbi:MAG: hypothetical protein HYX87_06845 [Chloroflexi bacterium]|nr:hypothetical protein [Chloroflexota bacterium]
MLKTDAPQIDTATNTKEEVNPPGEQGDFRLMHAARSRLKLELQGLAFAVTHGATPEEYARFLWGTGAQRWMGKDSPAADEYLLKEEEAMSHLFPWIKAQRVKMSPTEAEAVLLGGCLGGWGEKRFNLARSLGLFRKEVCRYCIEACRVWGEQLGLKVVPVPKCRAGCRLTVSREAAAGAACDTDGQRP